MSTPSTTISPPTHRTPPTKPTAKGQVDQRSLCLFATGRCAPLEEALRNHTHTATAARTAYLDHRSEACPVCPVALHQQAATLQREGLTEIERQVLQRVAACEPYRLQQQARTDVTRVALGELQRKGLVRLYGSHAASATAAATPLGMAVATQYATALRSGQPMQWRPEDLVKLATATRRTPAERIVVAARYAFALQNLTPPSGGGRGSTGGQTDWRATTPAPAMQ